MKFHLPKQLQNCRSLSLKFATLPRIDSSPYVLVRVRVNGHPVGRVQLGTALGQTRRPGGGAMPDVMHDSPEPFFAALPLTSASSSKPTTDMHLGRLGDFVYELLDGIKLDYVSIDEGQVSYTLQLEHIPTLHTIELELCHPPCLAGKLLVTPDYNLVMHIVTLDTPNVEAFVDPDPDDDSERTKGKIVSVAGHCAYVVDHNKDRVALSSIRDGYVPQVGDPVLACTTGLATTITAVATSEPAAVVALGVEADAN